MFIDIHCHIDDEKFNDAKSVVAAYLKDGVDVVINAGANVGSSISSCNLSKEFESVYFAAGIHPSDIHELNKENLDLLKSLALDKKCVAIGEIGLDYHFLPFDKEKQKQGFIKQIELANELNLPIVVHSRDAAKDTLDIIKNNTPKCGGVMHCFSGSCETAKEYVKEGFYISFGGTLTFKNAVNLREVALSVPTDRILTETDSPYLAPTPLRGTVNQPKNVSLVTAFLGELLGKSVEETANIIRQNAERLFYKLKNN